MARIPDEQLTRLKEEVSVQRLAEAMGISLKRHGADLMGLCPFHDDREPSLVISPKKNLWHCLGACQTGGSVIDWVMKAEGVSFRHAAELLLADYQPSLAAGSGEPVRHSTVKKLPTALETQAEDARLLVQVIDYYHETLKNSPEALAYLEKRGLGGTEMIERFRLGFANRTLGYRLPAKNRKEGAAIRGRLQRLGILRASGHEHFNGSLVIPVVDGEGRVTEVYGRKLNDRLRKGTPLHLYLPGPHAGVWNEAALEASPEIIVCESLIDALTFWCAGYRNVTASYGTEGFTADHLTAFKRHGTERVLIAYDRDRAGEAAAEKLSKKLLAEGLDCYRIHFPKGMDANEYALKVGSATQSLGVAIRSAVWLGKGQAKPVTTEPVQADQPARPAAEPKPEAPAAKEETASPFAAQPAPAPAQEKPDPAPECDEPAEPEKPLPAAVIPDAPKAVVAAEVSEREVVFSLGDRRYRVRGLDKNLSFDALKINLLVSAPALDGAGEALHVDTFDLYQQRPRSGFVKQAAVELGVKEDVIKHDLGRVLLKLEALQEDNIRAAQAPENKAVSLSDAETQSALELLRSPDLLEHIRADFARCGVVGEAGNVLVGYLAAISRKLDNPLAVTIQSTSAAGKSSLMDAIVAFVPGEERIKYSALTGQSLFYMGERDLKHKVLAIVEEEGASNAAYALKLLQSEGELTIASTGKDPVTGELKTQDYRVEGPVMMMLTTTAIDIDEELLNRCLVLSVDEGRAQTRAIHALQRDRRTLPGLLAKTEREAICCRHQNAQRLIKPLAVVNPYARHLNFVSDRTRTRRDHEKYLTLIDAIALLHQHQRPVKTVQHHGRAIRYVEVTLDDIAQANALAHEVLGRTLDELPPQTRKLLGRIVAMVSERCERQAMSRADYRFSRREVREYTCWSDTALKVHLARLAEMEYLLIHRGGRGQSFVYELLYDGALGQDQPHVSGLIDVAELRQAYDADRSGPESVRSESGQGAVGGRSGPGPAAENPPQVNGHGADSDPATDRGENAEHGPERDHAPYRHPTSAARGR